MTSKMHTWLIRQQTHVIAITLALATFVLIFSQASRVGYTRDEGFYFAAAESLIKEHMSRRHSIPQRGPGLTPLASGFLWTASCRRRRGRKARRVLMLFGLPSVGFMWYRSVTVE